MYASHDRTNARSRNELKPYSLISSAVPRTKLTDFTFKGSLVKVTGPANVSGRCTVDLLLRMQSADCSITLLV